MKTLLLILASLTICTQVSAYTDEQIASAIFRAENSKSHPYGILTHYKTTTPKQACLNTIAHARRDLPPGANLIEFLGSRYAPLKASNDPNNLNSNWIKNVNYFLNKGEK
jgi:hypothetical protein